MSKSDIRFLIFITPFSAFGAAALGFILLFVR